MALNKYHEMVVASCYCYSFTLIDSASLRIVQALKNISEVPASIHWNIPFVEERSFAAQMTVLNNALTGKRFEAFPFELKFQIQKLAQNGYLPPMVVVPFMQVIAQKSQGISSDKTTKAVRRLFGQIPFAGPATEAAEFSLQTLSELLEENQTAIAREESYTAGFAAMPEHICNIYKAVITPTSTLLFGRIRRSKIAFSGHIALTPIVSFR